MFRRKSLLVVSCIAIAVIVGGLWLFWPADALRAPGQVNPPILRQTGHTPAAISVAPPTVAPVRLPAAAATINTPAPRESSASVDTILRDTSLDNVAAARALGTLVQDPALSLEARTEALAHMLNLSIDNETALLLPLLKSKSLPDSLATAIIDEALNRPLTWQADACLAVLSRSTGKELHAQVRDHLGFLTGEDHGEDLDAWIAAVRNTRAKWEKDGK